MLSLMFPFLLQYIHCANITVQPVSINTTLNSTVVFSCEAVADELGFRVNNEVATDEAVVAKGFSVTTTNIGGTRRVELEAIAYEYNNNTEVTCTAITDEPLQAVFSNISILMIQGLLDSVNDLDYTFINGSSVLLIWTAPYTLDNVHITGYYVVNGLMNITTTNNTNITLSATNPDPCIINNVSVSPINDVGIGLSNNISFYYETVVVPVIDGQKMLLNISINVSALCKAEYPNNITVNILNTNNAVISNTSIIPQVNDHELITGSTLVTNLNMFIVNVSLSNNGGTFNNMPSFGFSFLGPVTSIASSINNCSTISITWTTPTVDNRLPIQYYILRIYDTISGSLVDTVSVYDTSYQFVDDNLFINRYTYVITGVNGLGEGISNNNTFSYQRVPRAVANTSLNVLSYTQNLVIVQFYIPIILECVGEAPEHVTITVMCNEIDSITTNQIITHIDITGLISVPQYQQCNISIVLTNGAGCSEPFILAFDTYPPSPITNATTTATQSFTAMPTSLNNSTVITAVSLSFIIISLLICFIVLAIMHKWKLCKSASLQQQEVPTARNEAYEFNTLMINNNPAYEQIGRGGAVNM
ncbi:PREDICTED: uncharacterized protein LOC109582213 isoform X2 [Amphimedon queenslandica]|uniref:Fibronectin type-III domain-containing protein n=1 Tax=Amphimedon queenslandica TaxID=400682 RepID=A0AAN0J6V2_AMPQE|nr:PREDICTED: uncharacterized protein LOC109582213 isoform X2 [Amphimedon queenslandica]|eukprot:XP_019852423.1 PREDICTED: uncharacterized protein LOC109582213 isoform X2 [Amphimedon queenslandica]